MILKRMYSSCDSLLLFSLLYIIGTICDNVLFVGVLLKVLKKSKKFLEHGMS
jgi:hypothetical protein